MISLTVDKFFVEDKDNRIKDAYAYESAF